MHVINDGLEAVWEGVSLGLDAALRIPRGGSPAVIQVTGMVSREMVSMVSARRTTRRGRAREGQGASY